MYTFITCNGAEHIAEFCNQFEYPKEATTELLRAFNILLASEKTLKKFAGLCENYRNSYALNEDATVNDITVIADEVGINVFTLNLLYFIFLVPHYRELFALRGYSEQICHDTLLDMKYKLFECKNIYEIWGNSTAKWTMGIFKLEIFALGRLEFNLHKFQYSYSDLNHTVNEGDIVISTHIPSSGPLLRDDYLKSYAMAEEFFKDYFKDRDVVFYCASWLLAPSNKLILPANSRIREFADDYIIFKETQENENFDLWRIFGVKSFENVNELPQDTSLRKNFVKWLSKGESISYGTGIFFYKNGVILK